MGIDTVGIDTYLVWPWLHRYIDLMSEYIFLPDDVWTSFPHLGL